MIYLTKKIVFCNKPVDYVKVYTPTGGSTITKKYFTHQLVVHQLSMYWFQKKGGSPVTLSIGFKISIVDSSKNLFEIYTPISVSNKKIPKFYTRFGDLEISNA